MYWGHFFSDGRAGMSLYVERNIRLQTKSWPSEMFRILLLFSRLGATKKRKVNNLLRWQVTEQESWPFPAPPPPTPPSFPPFPPSQMFTQRGTAQVFIYLGVYSLLRPTLPLPHWVKGEGGGQHIIKLFTLESIQSMQEKGYHKSCTVDDYYSLPQIICYFYIQKVERLPIWIYQKN
jgi:hypothetical protein